MINQEELINKIKKALLKYEKALLDEKKLDEELLYLMNNQ